MIADAKTLPSTEAPPAESKTPLRLTASSLVSIVGPAEARALLASSMRRGFDARFIAILEAIAESGETAFRQEAQP